jgi:hypothetical protein
MGSDRNEPVLTSTHFRHSTQLTTCQNRVDGHSTSLSVFSDNEIDDKSWPISDMEKGTLPAKLLFRNNSPKSNTVGGRVEHCENRVAYLRDMKCKAIAATFLVERISEAKDCTSPRGKAFSSQRVCMCRCSQQVSGQSPQYLSPSSHSVYLYFASTFAVVVKVCFHLTALKTLNLPLR